MSGAAPMISRVRSERIISTDLSEQYDYCMVFKRENDANGQPLVDPDHAKYIIHVMKDSGLDVYPFYSVQQDELLCLIRCGVSYYLTVVDFADILLFSSYFKSLTKCENSPMILTSKWN
jgi:hypothetical protein